MQDKEEKLPEDISSTSLIAVKTEETTPLDERIKREDEAGYKTVSSSSSSASDEEQDSMGISTLLTAAARLESEKKKSPAGRISSKLAATTAIPNNDTSLTGVGTLLHAASAMSPLEKKRVTATASKTGKRSAAATLIKSSSSSEDKESNARPKKRQASNESIGQPLSADERFQPSKQELEEATTQRSRNALFSWYDRLRDLYEYKLKHGDCIVPQKYPENHALGIWVNKQRMEKRLRDQGLKTTMTNHRLKLLNEIGFHWAKHKGQVSWDHRYQELCEFHRKNGHCIVPTKYRENKALGRWVSTQRAQLKEWKRGDETFMTQERYDKLCALGFHFELLPSKKKSEDGSVNSNIVPQEESSTSAENNPQNDPIGISQQTDTSNVTQLTDVIGLTHDMDTLNLPYEKDKVSEV